MAGYVVRYMCPSCESENVNVTQESCSSCAGNGFMLVEPEKCRTCDGNGWIKK
jgi:DnaJ-class molecular chaperone